MNTIIELFHSHWLQTLGYTLLHSIWQAGIVLVFVLITLRFVPTKLSNTRYTLASIGLLVILGISAGTFLYLSSTPGNSPVATEFSIRDQSQLQTVPQREIISLTYLYLSVAKSFIDSNISFFLMMWVSGTLIFSLRTLMGLLYVGKLRGGATLLDNEWTRRIQLLAQQLKIQGWVTLAESKRIQAPIVIGCLKPMILIPIGLCTTLTPEQLETIFLHELMHVRRKDYLINLVQSFLEALFFFNPFVWIISGIIKREREHCCDDAVIQVHGDAIVYAHALATLEEVRLSKVGLSVSLADNKNQLLNRIKRLMEKSVKNSSGGERIIPALLLVIGLICASWISNQSRENETASTQTPEVTVVLDTTKKDRKIGKNKKAETNKNENSKSKNEAKSNIDVTEEFETDYAHKFNQTPPPIPPFDIEIPNMAHLGPLFRDFHLEFEAPSFAWKSENDWEEFSKEFEENFKSKFGDFYQEHEQDIQRMMEEAQQKINSKFGEDWEVKMQDFAAKQEAWAKEHAEDWERYGESFAQLEEKIKKSEEDLNRWEEHESLHTKEFEKNQEQFTRRMKEFEEKSKEFEIALRKELIRDGYLSEDEKLNNMHWHNGSIEINGKKIKASDEKKYNELHAKYFRLGED